jgi:hypothetical protein
VVVVTVAEHPSTIEQVMLPQLDVAVIPGVAVLVVFHVEHDCVQTDTEDAEHELEVEDVDPVSDCVGVGVGEGEASEIQNGSLKMHLRSGRHDPSQVRRWFWRAGRGLEELLVHCV